MQNHPVQSGNNANGTERWIAGDIYGLSVVIWEMLAGEIPWADFSASAVKDMMVRENSKLAVPIPSPDSDDEAVDIPSRLEKLLKHGLSRKYQKRVQNMHL